MSSLRHQSAPAIALAVAAHPDDIEYMAGATLAAWIAAGTSVHYLLVTDGAGGSRDPLQTPEALASQRREEQREAAGILGVSSATFLGYRDAEVEPSRELKLAIARVIRQVRPEVVLTFDPHLHYHNAGINHTDHLAVGASTLAAVMPLANTRLAAPELIGEGLEPHDVAAVYLFEAAQPTHWMPVTSEEVARKIAALRAHVSQMTLWDGGASAHARAQAAARIARTHGIACDLAEAFACIQLAPASLTTSSSRSSRRRIVRPDWANLGQLARPFQFVLSGFETPQKSR